MVIHPNVITLTANVSRCSSGGSIVKYIYKGTPAVSTTKTTTTVTNPCSGAVSSNSATITVNPFPGTTSGEYQWYYNNSYIGTGLTNTFNNSDALGKNYEVRFNGPCGISIAAGIVEGIGSTPTCTPPQIYTNTTTSSVTDPCNGTVTSSSATVTINLLPCTSAGNYEWYVNGVYNGTGLSKIFNTTYSQTYNWEIRYNGPCGVSLVHGTIYGNLPPLEPLAKLGPNPVVDYIIVDTRRPYCPPIPSEPFTVSKSKNLVTSIEIYDNFGNQVKYQSFKTPLDMVQIDVKNIKRGNYRLKINYADKFEIQQIMLVD